VIAIGIQTGDRPEKDVFELIYAGDWVKADSTKGIIEVKGKERYPALRHEMSH
jgi:hypothetical protein